MKDIDWKKITKQNKKLQENCSTINVHGEQKVKTVHDRYYGDVKTTPDGSWGDITIGRNFGNIEMW